MMKAIHLIATLVLLHAGTASHAQITFGRTGMSVKSGTTISMHGLTLETEEDLNIADNKLTVHHTPVPGNPRASIGRVYQFSNYLPFSGRLSMRYLSSELNGNHAAELQIAHSGDGKTFTRNTASTTDVSNYLVSAVLNNVNLMTITAAGPEGALPVTLTTFSVTAEGNAGHLQWTTASETNADYFEIEHSTDARTWQAVGRVEAVGQSSWLVPYRFVHHDLSSGRHYYRLKMVDRDQRFARSAVKDIRVADHDIAYVYPNPVAERLFLHSALLRKSARVQIIDQSGNQLAEMSGVSKEGVYVKYLLSGKYILKVLNVDGSEGTYSFVRE